MPRPARWECEGCHHLLGEIRAAQLRLARCVDEVLVVPGGVAVICPGCGDARIWQDTSTTTADAAPIPPTQTGSPT